MTSRLFQLNSPFFLGNLNSFGLISGAMFSQIKFAKQLIKAISYGFFGIKL